MSVSVYSVEGLINWLETQPPKTKYTFVNGKDCLITRYIRAVTGREEPSTLAEVHKWGFEKIANAPHRQTYGAALYRAKKQLAAA